MYKLQFDGGSRGNPGIGGCGAIIFKDSVKLWNGYYYLGENTTNNVAEYKGLLNGLKFLSKCDVNKLFIEGDSKLVIKQILGQWKVKNDTLKNIHYEVLEYIKIIENNRNNIIDFRHMCREQNKIADKLANIAMDTKTNFEEEFTEKKEEKTWETFFDENSILINEINDLIDADREIFKDDLKILPPNELRYNAFKLCSFDNIKVVILGQDPYHKVGEAMGLCFSVPREIKIPPSLRNIFKELYNDLGIERKNPDLSDWAKQGVLLLNTALTVREHCPNSHARHWKSFSNKVIKYISDNKEGVIFVLWGNNAISKRKLIDESKHNVLCAAHPSPLSANRGGFFECKHFSGINMLLHEKNKLQINW